MTKVKTYCPTWRASDGSTMIEYTRRDSQPDLYVDYHDYKAMEAELAEAVKLLRAAWDAGSFDSVGFANTADQIDAFLARQEAKHE